MLCIKDNLSGWLFTRCYQFVIYHCKLGLCDFLHQIGGNRRPWISRNHYPMTRSSTGTLKLLTTGRTVVGGLWHVHNWRWGWVYQVLCISGCTFFCLCSGHCQAKFSKEILPNLLSILVTTLNDLWTFDSKFLIKNSSVTASRLNSASPYKVDCDEDWFHLKAEFINGRMWALHTTSIILRYNLVNRSCTYSNSASSNLCDVYSSTCSYRRADLHIEKQYNDRFKIQKI